MSTTPPPAKPVMVCDYTADYLGVSIKTLDFMQDPAFDRAWTIAKDAARVGYGDNVPDIRWRVHTAVWAAQHGLNIEGDFVECGVFTGFLSLTICNFLDFSKVDKNFYLFDVWGSIPIETVRVEEQGKVHSYNKIYGAGDVYEFTRKAFSPFPNAKLVRGLLPATLDAIPGKIAYMSIDLNHTQVEEDCIHALWPKLSLGAVVVIDDYGWRGHEGQRRMWDNFAREKKTAICNLPTGQGLLIRI